MINQSGRSSHMRVIPDCRLLLQSVTMERMDAETVVASGSKTSGTD